MALSIFLQSSRKLPALTNAASKLMTQKFTNSNLILTSIAARNFTGLSRTGVLDTKKFTVANTQVIQSRPISHSTIWAMEKILSVALIGIIPVCIAIPNPILDQILALSVVLHMHWGVEAVVVDYIRPSLCGKIIPPIARTIVYIATALTFGGLIYFNFNDVGMACAIRRIWSLGKDV